MQDELKKTLQAKVRQCSAIEYIQAEYATTLGTRGALRKSWKEVGYVVETKASHRVFHRQLQPARYSRTPRSRIAVAIHKPRLLCDVLLKNAIAYIPYDICAY